MELNFVYVFFGAIIGAVISSLTIFAFNFLIKQSKEKSRLYKDSIIRSIGELCAEIDGLITSNKNGILNNSGIQNVLRKKHSEILRQLKPHMHVLDVYFVKYIDYVQKEYLNYITGTSEETNASLTMHKSISFSIDTNPESPKNPEDAKNIEIANDKKIPVTNRTGSVEHDLHVFENAFFKEPSIVEIQQPDVIADIENEVTFEDDKTSNYDKKKTSLNEDNKLEPTYEFNESNSALMSTSIDNEEFSMETIVDLDISKLKSQSRDYKASNLTKKDSVKIKKENTEKVQKTPEFPAPVSLIEESIKSNFPAKKTEDFEKTQLKTTSVEPIKTNDDNKSEDKKDIDITGEDVANQIDSFFGFDKDK
jgi:hypothetical protein